MTPDLRALAEGLAADLATLHRARRIASPWLAGMLDGCGCRIVSVSADQASRIDGFTLRPINRNLAHDDVPDLSDPVTVQALLLLAREAWGDPGLTVGEFIAGGWRIARGQAGGWALFLTADTEVEALCAAIHAAAEVTP